jgi:putative protease
LETLEVHLTGEVILPVSSLNQLRRELVAQLEEQRSQPPRWQLLPTALSTVLPSLPTMKSLGNGGVASAEPTPYRHSLTPVTPELIGLVRNLEQMEAAIATGLRTLYCDFEDPRRYRMAVEQFRTADLGRDASIWVAPPRITKPAETWILEQVKRSQADGYLVRNYDHLAYFADDRCRGDFSLNVANPLTADYFINHYHLERVTAAYDLNHHQLCDLLRQAPPHWIDITIHQHMPMFHMEHCVFCAFLSEGTDFTNCGRPCEQHTVLLREGRRPGGPRVSTDHVLSADAGCRNTVLNGTAQTGAEHVQQFLGLGAIAFRLEFLKESTLEVTRAIAAYQQLLAGEISGQQLWKSLNLTHQLGVTRGTFSE